MVTVDGDVDNAAGIRTRLAELCHASGLLGTLQHARTWLRRDLRILAYHRVLESIPQRFDFDLELVSTDAAGFRAQMQLLKRRFVPMTLGDALAMLDAGERLPAQTVVVTFDDGYDDNYHVAWPILQELQVPATFFVSTGHIDSGLPFAYDWLVHMIMRGTSARLVAPELGLDVPMPQGRPQRRIMAGALLRHIKTFEGAVQRRAIAQLERDWDMPRTAGTADCQPMTWDQLREMVAGGCEVGSHGVDHRMLAKLPQDELEAELTGSKATLERELGRPAPLIAYPVGSDHAFDERVIKATVAAGYSAGCSYICGSNPVSALNRHSLLRLPVERDMGQGWFAAMLTLPELVGYPTVTGGDTSGLYVACSR